MDNIEEFFHLYAFEKAKNAFGNNCRGNGKIASLVFFEIRKLFLASNYLFQTFFCFYKKNGFSV